MQTIKLHLWNEEITLEKAFLELLTVGLEQSVLRELGKKMLYLKNFTEYQVIITDQTTVDSLLKSFCDKLKLKSPADLDKWVDKTNQTRESFTRQLVFSEQVNRLKRIVVTDDMVKEAFLQRKVRMDSILFGLIRVDQEALARELYYRINDDQQDFAAIAKQYSVGPEGPSGGLVGPKIIQELNPELKKFLTPLRPGEVTEPFTLDGKQYIIARLIRIDNAQLSPALEASLRDELFEQWTERQLSLADIKVIDGPQYLRIGNPLLEAGQS